MTPTFSDRLLLEPSFIQSTAAAAKKSRESVSSMLFPSGRQALPQELHDNRIEIIQVQGSISHHGARSYDEIERRFAAALENDAIEGIAFMIDSPGGAAAGCFDLCDFIYESRSQKPTLAIINDHANSSAYAIASSCQRVAISRTGLAGSVGVVMMHVDISGALDQFGEKVTLIYSGSHKVDGNPYQPLPEGVRSQFQADSDDLYDMFVSLVARNRKMDARAVRATQAQIYRGKDAAKIGFADQVMPAREALEQFSNQLQKRSFPMSIKVSALKESLKAQGVDAATIANLNLPTDDNALVDLDGDAPQPSVQTSPRPPSNVAGMWDQALEKAGAQPKKGTSAAI